MTREVYEQLIADFDKAAKEVCARKRADYAKEYDVLDNFKLVADLIGCDPKLVWAVFFAKHVVSACKFAGGQQLASESIDSRFHDLKNYVDLGYALVVEERNDANGNATEFITEQGVKPPAEQDVKEFTLLEKFLGRVK